MKIQDSIDNEPFWSISAKETAELLNADLERGLAENEAENRLDKFGLNISDKKNQTTALKIFFDQFKSPLIIILIIAGVITAFIAHIQDALFIFAAVAVNSLLGFYQENKAERAIEELKNYLKQNARVIRSGREYEIDASKIVPGDLIRLAQGDRVPADARLVYINDLQIDESILTGESLPSEKSVDMSDEKAGLADQNSMLFAGTLVTQGVGTAVVCRTGKKTELGKIADLVAGPQTESTPLQIAIKKFSVHLSIFLGFFTLIIFAIGLYKNQPLVDMFITSVAIAVSAIPEGLPIALTVILAIGVQRMAKRNGVIRKLIAAEALGSTTVILTDKTGTLTMAQMELNQVIPMRGSQEDLLSLAVLNSDVSIENPEDQIEEWRMNGRIMEIALVRAASKRGINVNETKNRVKVLNSLPFNAVNKFSISLIGDGSKKVVFFGAPDILLKYSDLNDEDKTKVYAQINSIAEKGERILGVATKIIRQIPETLKNINPEGLSFEGLITFRDPIRLSVKSAIASVEKAGIKTIIVTGDHKGTAEAVARMVGLPIGEDSVLDATELRDLNDKALLKRLHSVRVISRVSPTDKVRIAKAFQEMGEIVAMTGDGVNDAPSIKQADIGIAMGSGTSVARSVADLVLLDDNFETISAAVEEGRRILSNIKKAIVYLLSNVSDELFLIGGSLILGIPLPLNALQILWVNFFSDSFPAIAFAFESKIDTNPKIARAGAIMDPLMKFLVIFIGLSTSFLLFAIYYFLIEAGFDEALVKTFIFASFGTYTLFVSLALRSLDKSIFEYNFLSNRYLLTGVSVGMILMALSIYLPVLQGILKTTALPPVWALGVILFGVINIAAMEFGKWFYKTYLLKN